jgi:hypothetical protein
MRDVTIRLAVQLQVNVPAVPRECIGPIATSASYLVNGWQETCINLGQQCDTSRCRPIPDGFPDLSGAPMRQTYVKNQFDAAIRNVESALDELTDRLHSLPGPASPRSTLRHAGRTLRRKAGSLAGHVPFERASEMAADTGRVVRQHPVKTVITAAIAGYCIWTLIQYSAGRAAQGRSSRFSDAERNRRLQEDISRDAGVPEDEIQPRH